MSDADNIWKGCTITCKCGVTYPFSDGRGSAEQMNGAMRQAATEHICADLGERKEEAADPPK